MKGSACRGKIYKHKLLYLTMLGILPCIGYAKVPQENPLKQNWDCTAKNGEWSCQETDSKTSALFDINAQTPNKDEVIAEALGWIETNDPDNFCGGYYYTPDMQQDGKDDQDHKTHITGGQAQYKIGGNVSIEGGVEITQGDRLITANEITLRPNLKTNKVESIESTGDVNLRQPGQLIVSNNIRANVQNDTAQLTDTYYLLKVNANPSNSKKRPKGYTDPHFTGYARGKAKSITQYSKTRLTLENATYTTCSPYSHDWQFSAESIDVDRAKGWAAIYNGYFEIQDVPVMYIPYLTFPVNEKRKSGFLFPQAGSIDGSIYYQQPYYFNIAPNLDFLFAPAYYTGRGLMADGNFRYLFDHNEGALSAEYMPYDQRYGGSRGYIALKDHGEYGQHWSSNIDFGWASDQSFISDFSNNIVGANQTLIEQSANLKYNTENLYFNAKVLNFQVLDSILYPVNTPYSTLPQIDFNAEYPTTLKSVSLGIENQYTYFYKPELDGQQLVNGSRFYSRPHIGFPFQESWGYIKPTVSFSETFYDLNNRQGTSENINGTTTGQHTFPNQNPNRALPMVNVNAGLNFERTFETDEKTYNQTLEPKLFYNYIPYTDQNDIPIFDTNFTNFTYASLFAVNRFSGYDRINNANQLSYALETNINDTESGGNVFSAGVGQMYYFEEQEVSLCDTSATTGCLERENPNFDQTLSNVAGYADYQFFEHWHINGNLSYAADKNTMDVQEYSIMYKPDAKHILNLSYQNIINDYSLMTPQDIFAGVAPPDMEQITGSAIWSITEELSVLGFYSYSISFNQPINMFAGLQYDQCSWAVRALFQRFISSLNTNNPSEISNSMGNSFVISFELKGVGSTSEGSLQGMMTQIPGYEPFYSGID